MTMRKVAGRLLAALGLAGAASGAAQAQDAAQEPPVAPVQAPAAWVAYAEEATGAVSAWLEDDSASSVAVRTYMGAAEAEAGEPRPLELKLWIDAEGRVSRIDFTPFVHAEANAALTDALVGRAFTAPPPAGMLQPLRIEVQAGGR
ncbi:hypothetical protein [Brevundimonas sp. GCM10030266]|uniref:hypothetical protein n=1 Tax=Brevundimonas sp. GCM10030266 TaxID=3273386 RepID=UPI0036096877